MQRRLGFRCFKSNPACHQTLQGFAFNLDTAGQTAGQRDAAGIPETGRSIDQILVFLLDMDTDHQLLFGAGELIALHRADLDLLVEDRAADIQRAQVLGKEHHMQAR